MIEGRIDGRAELRRVQGILAGSDAELTAAVRKGLPGALDPLKVEIPEAARARMPTSGGYAALLAAATRVLVRIATGEASATVKVTAMGKRESRDIRARNRGSLRHPTYGNKSSRGWQNQRVRPGMVDDPLKKAERRTVRMVKKARDLVAEHILKG